MKQLYKLFFCILICGTMSCASQSQTQKANKAARQRYKHMQKNCNCYIQFEYINTSDIQS